MPILINDYYVRRLFDSAKIRIYSEIKRINLIIEKFK